MAVHYSHMTLPYPIRGARFTILAPNLDADGDPVDPTGADTEISKNNGNFGDCAEEIVVPAVNRGGAMMTFTGADTDCVGFSVWFGNSSGKPTFATFYPRTLAIAGSGTLSAGSASGGTLGTLLLYDVTGCFIMTTGGTGGGGTGGANNQARKIITYNTSSGAFTICEPWEVTPSSDTTYKILLPEGVTLGMLRALNPTVFGTTLTLNSGQVLVAQNNDKTGYFLGNNAITASVISNAAITATKIQDGALTAAKFASGAFDAVWTVSSRTLTSLAGHGLALATKLTKYVQLLARNDSAIAVDNTTELNEINASGGSGPGSFANTADSLRAIRVRGDSAWLTATSVVISASGLTASGFTSGALEAIADSILTRNVSNVEATCPEHCLATVVLASLEWEVSGSTLTIKRTNGTTTHFAKTVTSAAGDPITSVN